MAGSQKKSALACIAEADERSGEKYEPQIRELLELSPMSCIVEALRHSTISRRIAWVREDEEDPTEREESCSEEGDGLFKNAFKIKNTPESAVKSRPKARRLLGMASRRFSSPDAPMSPSIDKENSSGVCNSRGANPQKVGGAKKARIPLEDCDPNSQDSGYEASYPEREEKVDGFRFAEPLALAPRRMSIESRSPMASPVRSSPQRARVARTCLFRSLSSGYESMDDGFNDLIDVESLDDATQLPNGISTLLCGDIVGSDATAGPATPDSFSLKVHAAGIPSTPEFSRTTCRTSNLRRSVSLQNNDRQEGRKSFSAMSKVRSCLFRSPNASSSTAYPGFEDTSPLTTTTTTTTPSGPVARRRRISHDLSERSIVKSIVDSPISIRAFKRPDPPIDQSPKLVKRLRRSDGFFDEASLVGLTKTVPLQRSLSESATSTTVATVVTVAKMETEEDTQEELESHTHIKSAIHRSTTDTDLTGDFSKPCILPLATGHHEDLKSISPNTLAALIRGDFNDRIGSFKIVDCRYPYEFDAGHIQGALNLYNKDLIEQILLDPLTSAPEIQPDTNKRNILVFHCEFSWERGPNLSRFLRNLDRQRNKEHYPALHYPEVYLLHGGYELFYKEQKGLCSPQGYRPMRHPDHEADFRQFRSKSKSWQGEKSRIGSCVARTNLMRLGF